MKPVLIARTRHLSHQSTKVFSVSRPPHRNKPSTHVLVFGTFDPLHAGHSAFFAQARALGDHLTVIVARDSTIRRTKGREPFMPETQRCHTVAADPAVDEVRLGDADPERYQALRELAVDVIAVGYDQTPDDGSIRTLLRRLGKPSVRVMRLVAHHPDRYKSSYVRTSEQSPQYDLHLHSTYSDGDDTPAELIAHAVTRGLKGGCLTDHNGVWGTGEFAAAAQTAGFEWVEGVEITARWGDVDIHLLGYSHGFQRQQLEQGLAATRQGYEQRIQTMIEQCQRQGYDQITFADVAARRAGYENPSYISYDVARLLQEKHRLTPAEARQLTVHGGACWVPYGDWALTPATAIDLIHATGGRAVLAHPGTIIRENGPATFAEVFRTICTAGLDGLEVIHPFHTSEHSHQFQQLAAEYRLVVTGGSDWHGADRYGDDVGHFGLDDEHWRRFTSMLV